MENKRKPESCPYCQAEERGCSDAWGMSPEGWDMLEKIHIEEHCDRCPACGQTIRDG